MNDVSQAPAIFIFFFPKVASSRINWWKLWLSVDCLSIWQAGHYLGSSQVNGNIVIIPKWAIMLDQHIISPLVLQHQLDRKKSEILCQSLSKRDSIIIFRSSDQSSAQSWLSKTHQQDLDLTIQEFSSYQLKIKASKCCSWDEKPESYSFPKNQLSWINTSVRGNSFPSFRQLPWKSSKFKALWLRKNRS